MYSLGDGLRRSHCNAPRVGLFDISEQTAVPKELHLSLKTYFTSQVYFLVVIYLHKNSRCAWEAASLTRVPSY
jgi:hypothetical protein